MGFSVLTPLATRRLALVILITALVAACSNDHVVEQTAKPQQRSSEEDSRLETEPETVATVAPEEPLLEEAPLVTPGVSASKAYRRIDQSAKRPRTSVADAMGSSELAMHQALPTIYYQGGPVDRENYITEETNPIQRVAEQPVSTFSVDVDTAAYSNVRRMLAREGRLPPASAVKAEEFINYFDYQYPTPDNTDIPFSVSTEIAPSPWNANTHLLKVGLRGYQSTPDQRPASNLVFLVDVSGSMQSPFKLALVKQSLRLLVKQMRAEDRIALVVYAGAAGLVLDSTPGDQKAKILTAIDALEAGGSTNGGAGIQLAYQVAKQHLIKGGINRVLVASDGDMNVGTTDMEALKDMVKRQRQQGVALTTLGFGSGNYNYALMEQLADVGNGNAAYIDSLKEAHKVLVKQLSSTLLIIAKDVKIQIEFNPDIVAEYRLIGYENRLLRREDFRNDKIDAGEIGAGHTVTAFYEIALKNSGGERISPLRYQTKGETNVSLNKKTPGTELAYVQLRYKTPDNHVGDSNVTAREIAKPILVSQIHPSLTQASNDFRFAAAVAGYAQLLQGGDYTGTWRFKHAADLARAAKGNDPHGYRGELVTLVELAGSIASPVASATPIKSDTP